MQSFTLKFPSPRKSRLKVSGLSATSAVLAGWALLFPSIVTAQTRGPVENAAKQERFHITARASEIDPRVKAYPEINFLIEDAKGKPADQQQAMFNPNVNSRGQLVIWLMGHNSQLFEKLGDYGLHAIR
ncbi:MAG: hypothetical protein ABJM55_12285, partial [Rhodopirellula bahusiensis]